MLKADAQTASPGVSTKARIVDAALETLKAEGFAGTSARAIAGRGGFNQALVFYHFGSVRNLLLAALDETSRRRMEAYETALDRADSVAELLEVAREVYQEDLASGHLTVLTEMISGSLSEPELGPEITARMEPWIAFAEKAVAKAVAGTPFEGFLPTRDIAFGIVAFYIGADLLTILDGNRERVDRMFQMAQALAPMLPAIPKE